jgi:predicted phage terminase large subunit-like protein
MMRGAWNDDLLSELRAFPNGKHDDQVDALSRAFAELLGVLDPTPFGHQVAEL